MDSVSAARISDGMSKSERWAVAREEAGTLDEILCRVADGESLGEVCRWKGWRKGAVMLWLMKDLERFTAFRNALAASGVLEMEEAKAIADGTEDHKAKIDIRVVRAKAHAPDIYGQRLKVERSVNHEVDAALLGFASALLEKVKQPVSVPADRLVGEKDASGE